ncbi:uncharacterized protein LOC120461247 [Pimephales promelas]|uniref:uncharacterized protein LOC120461247 n=1 Tax=Pimephales promelas TaxID=90988 RepID=UPI0019559DE4|nr:uncharacterized protein LOC120461247 [Pimephales promelas]
MGMFNSESLINLKMRSVFLLVFLVTPVFSEGLTNVTSVADTDTPEMFSSWPYPCQGASNLNAFHVFYNQHVLQYNFDTSQTHTWADYLKKRSLCGVNPHQAFVHKNDGNAIVGICHGGGVRNSRNLCVSARKFRVFIVQSVWRNGRCVVQLQTEIAHVIVACTNAVFSAQPPIPVIHCIPVHFAGIVNTTPSLHGPRCKR